jgi:hypothetical protein
MPAAKREPFHYDADIPAGVLDGLRSHEETIRFRCGRDLRYWWQRAESLTPDDPLLVLLQEVKGDPVRPFRARFAVPLSRLAELKELELIDALTRTVQLL